MAAYKCKKLIIKFGRKKSTTNYYSGLVIIKKFIK